MAKGSILVTGGAGYIGAQMALTLAEAGYEPVILDDLLTGHRAAVDALPFVEGDVGDVRLVTDLLARYQPVGVLHFAGVSQAGQSVEQPALYYDRNLVRSLALLDALRTLPTLPAFVFSSSAAVYGEPAALPIREDHPCAPVNPYGATKLAVEGALEAYGTAYGLRWAALRYFNAAGADPQGRSGECHEPETHLIPLALQAAAGLRPPLNIHGRDYDTPDGTCIRDYVHVADLCRAHLLALENLIQGSPVGCVNLGGGTGRSVLEVIAVVGRVTGQTVPVADAPRRAGDPARLVADITRAKQILGWEPAMSDLDTIIGHAWTWEKQKHGTA
ncbi:MAG: UDP-glucose 4-epimerase GalE [Alphaproteobacteria bacterium]|nr:UDP-glucose 4-epimerase GalE [Alphaproteobacteria bacterium]MBU0798767.1 UDP-glucose 4-epimerase GalE [Alphaproteobacteria bacterium]MBU0886030.1 UDP-glucose 4-epimerase GalE [Alphaproteobacteria bacterium]MBU1812019.1 UDP-glucose 4-epimerase GalE [Alphaproteobacteria bacterium]MBU2090761.1 UDP-glucose 4-epimerase GalE [Alphaproteobacteria bacterium]